MRSLVRFYAIILLCLVIGSIGAQTNISHLRDCLKTVGYIKTVSVNGDYLYYGGEYASIGILNITDPMQPVSTGVLDIMGNGPVKKIECQGTRMTVFQDGLVQFFDATIASQPVYLASVVYQGSYACMAMSGDFTYVVSTGGLLYCWNMEDFQAPVLADSIQVQDTSSWNTMAIMGNRAYVSGDSDWQVFDISNPNDIFLIGTIGGTSSIRIAAYNDQNIYCINGMNGLSIYAIGTDSNLVVCSAGSQWGERISDISLGNGFIVISYIEVPGSHSIVPHYAFVNVADPTTPTYIDGWYYSGAAIDVCGDYFLVYSRYINIYSVGDGGATHAQLSQFTPGGKVKEIEQNTNYLVIRDDNNDIKVLGNLLSQEPVQKAVTRMNNVRKLTVSDDRLALSIIPYVDGVPWGTPYLRMYTINQSGSINHSYIHSFSGSEYLTEPTSGQIVGLIGYFAVSGKLFIANLSSLTEMQQISAIADYGINYVHVQGEYAYCGGYFDGGYKLLIFSLADLSAPALVSMLPVPYTVGAIGVRGNRLFAGGGWGSLLVVNITNPESPTQELSIPLANPVVDISVGANHVTVATTNSLHVYDAGNGANVTSLGNYNTASEVNGMEVRGNLVYMAQDTCIGVYDISQAIGLSTSIPEEQVVSVVPLSVYPNPFKSGDGVTIEVPKMQQARISVYNLKGQKVFTSQEYSLRNELNTLSWNGCDSQAKPLPSGLYFLSVSSGNQKYTKRITLVN